MFFRDLLVCNKNWSESTELVIISNEEYEAVSMSARSARPVFGNRQVLWFRDCVVMLL